VWRTSEAVEEKAADEVRRHCKVLVKDLEMARCEQASVLAEAKGTSVARRSEGEGPDGVELARSRVRAEVFYRWPTRLNSAGECVCKTTGHARAD
jgi:hypothetical protein